MKKLIMVLNTIFLTMPVGLTVISCKTGEYAVDTSTIEDYDWSKLEPNFPGYDSLEKYNLPSEINQSIELNVEKKEEYIDYSNFNTGYKAKIDIPKQAPTGVPLNSHFMPNGNLKKEVMNVHDSTRNDYINSILDWDLNTNKDAKYNISRIPLQKNSKVAKKWVNSQNINIKELNISNIIDELTATHNTIVGKNDTFSRGINNYQYNDIIVAWAGNVNQGIIIPPPTDVVQKTHLNGSKILGNIFLDGYHGLNKEMLKDFLKKDSEGNFLIVDVLIKLCVELGFDGWFWNNEPNGGKGNGKILDYKVVVEIMKQWNQKVKSSVDEKINNLILFGYKDHGSLDIDPKTKKPKVEEAVEIYHNTDYYLSDFGRTLKQSVDYLNYDKEKLKDVFNMYNTGVWGEGHKKFWNKDNIGSYDSRLLAYLLDSENSKEIPGYKNTYELKFKNEGEDAISNSIAMFSSHNPYEIAVIDSAKLTGITEIERDIYKLVYANFYDEMMYTGRNKSLSNDDKGVYTEDIEFKPDEKGYSYGYGDLILENTTLNDWNDVFFTNFSTGNGAKFASLNDEKGIDIENNYPWTNINIADVQPTYKWKINKSDNQKQLSLKDKISGFYDYYNPYLKGNSISLGSGFNNKGEIEDFILDSNTSYDWWIMGSNYIKNKSKDVEMIVKLTGNDMNIDDLKIIYDTDKNDEQAIEAEDIKIIKDQNGWFKITGKIDSNKTISKIGLKFKGGKGTLKLGQMTIKNSNTNLVNFETNYNNLKISSELQIERGNGTSNYRINFENFLKDSDIYSYYEIYAELNNKIIRITEGNKNDYYIKNLNWKANNFFIKVINNLTKKLEWIKVKLI
ncbi:endo-beta-N-acetylglucosaminidase [Spiroplasma turonicum]|uniref:Endo-beta-N-acetylglucosaminidase n=1 Tax=Spiroplasma turonicum TaxID=216946 RepID=A0A0K1P676_9MOLU|nr:hypothetical protein [Spiroplasma turonicum]AKU79770.1 endo-beta-N-acetylglucosaminidase [Spiroplasma turonicum]ALX70788.1 endo-beta-N-acetylglucosaminidase [Spiroplasma turonicum]